MGRMAEKVHIVLIADARYRPGLEATRRSMIECCPTPERLVFHVLDEQSAAPMADEIRTSFGTFRQSVMPVVRLFCAELFPDVDWVIFSDVDTLWFRDPCELWDLRNEDVSVQWVKDIPSTRRETASWQRAWNPAFDPDRYGCAGVMLMNLRRMRQTSFIARCRAFVQQHGKPPYADQDILNSVLVGDTALLPAEWDVIRDYPLSQISWRAGRPQLVLHIIGIGKYFNTSPGGRLPQFDIWYRFVYGRFCLPWPRRVLFNILAVFYPLLRFLPVPDQIRRAFFFAWLRARMF